MPTLFIELLQISLGTREQLSRVPSAAEWVGLLAFSQQQGICCLLTEGLDKLPETQRPSKETLLQWIGYTTQEETLYVISWKSACELAVLLKNKNLKTYVLKGFVLAECYPIPRHRRGVDLDCFLKSDVQDVDVWEQANSIVQGAGFEVRRDYYKNSTWLLPGLTVENHRYLTPFRGDKTLTDLERQFQRMMMDDKNEDRFEGTELFRPPVMVSALFLIEHAYSHFLHEGLNCRHILDWAFFSRKHKNEIDWPGFESSIDQYGFKNFFDSYQHLGQYLLGDVEEQNLTAKDKMMLADMWAPLDLHETVNGIRGKLALTGNFWRARWKFREFTDMSWLKALWIKVKGFLFIKDPKLV